jgi:hypothetical protein
MKKLVVVLFLALSACASSPKSTPQIAGNEAAAVPDNASSSYGEYGRVAELLLRSSRTQTGKTLGFLSYFDNGTSVKIVAGALKTCLTEEQAAQIANYFGSSAGVLALKAYSNYLLTGQFLKNPASAKADPNLDALGKTDAGGKLLSESSTIFKKIAIDALKGGGFGAQKALTADIGKDAVGKLLGGSIL